MEFVHVVPRRVLFPACAPHGFAPFGGSAPFGAESAPREGAPSESTPDGFVRTALEEGFFVERRHAERTPSLKQPIPYSIVASDERVLLVRRSKQGGERRLHEKLSIGLGGHVEPTDLERARRDGCDLFEAGTRRELHEELGLVGPLTVRRVGLVNDDTNPVGAVHVGLVQIVHVPGPVAVREREQLDGRLVDLEELRELAARGAPFETWSAFLLGRLEELLPRAALRA
jgi:predicted NUDIX family phosphoesterase